MADTTEAVARPVRLQLSRKKGFNLQAHSRAVNGLEAVFVARDAIWGNPFRVGDPSGWLFKDGGDPTPMIAALTDEQCVNFYRDVFKGFVSPEMHPAGHEWSAKWRRRMNCHPGEMLGMLRGKNLACWCAPGARWCHADVLLELAAPNIDATPLGAGEDARG